MNTNLLFNTFLTLYEPMALIWVTMAMLTWSHGTPSNLGTKRVKLITIYLSIRFYIFHFIPPTFTLHRTLPVGNIKLKLTDIVDEVLPYNPAEGMCCFSGFAICNNAHSQKESADHNQSLHSHDYYILFLVCSKRKFS